MKKVISIVSYVISIIFIIIYILAELSSSLFMSEFGRLFLLCGSCLFLYFGGFFLSKYLKNNIPMKVNLWLFFLLYCVLLITLTLFDPSWGRNGFGFINWTKENFSYYLENSVNLIPFKTIIGYINSIFNSLVNTSNIFFNLFGNVICLMPLALFIPLLFNKINNSKKFLISILFVTLGIELIQFITFTGSCDIDDIILNILGAFIMYKILNINEIKKLVNNIFLLQSNKINKKKVILILMPIFLIIVLSFGLYKVASIHYDSNLSDYLEKINYKLEIIDETNYCYSALEKFYENELYEYYFECIKSNYVYAIINDNEKYLVKDLLNNNPTDYIISIDKLQRAGLKFIKEEKYDKIELSLEGSVYILKEIEDESILKIGSGKSEQGINESLYEVFLIPLKEGSTILEINVHDSTTSELVNVLKYSVIIDSNLQLTYEVIK